MRQRVFARYFGSEYLRPELEKARARLVNLVSLSLEHSSGGDLRRAAEALRDHSFLSRSKGGSDLLKALIAMPQNSHFGMNERGGFTDKHIPLLGDWTGPYRYQLVLPLTLATGGSRMPDWVGFEKTIAALRRQAGGGNPPAKGKKSPATRAAGFTIALPPQLPQAFVEVVEAVRQSILADLPRILDASVPVRKLFDQTPAFIGRYFWIEDGLSEVDHHDRSASEAWHQLTGGHSDDSSLLTLFLGVAAGAAPKTLLTEKGAATLVRKIRKSGLQPALARAFIRDHAPLANQDDYADLWEGFVEEAQATLCSDRDYELKDALALLRRECNVKPSAGGRG